MSFANVLIGTIPGDGQGEPLRSAFNKINQNFANIDVGNITVNVTAPVQSVAGRTGNVVLTVNDIPGAASAGYVDSSILVALGTARNYTDLTVSTTISNTVANLVASAPGTLDTLNELAAALGDDANFSTTVLDRLAGIDANISTLANLSVANLSAVTDDLSASISTETARAIAAESALGALIANAESNISLTESNLSGEIAAVESSLINLISNTDSNLASINADLSSSISDVNANVATLNSDLATESNVRATADTTLQNNIDALSTQHNNDINEEANARIAGDAALQANIDAVTNSLGAVATSNNYNDLDNIPMNPTFDSIMGSGMGGISGFSTLIGNDTGAITNYSAIIGNDTGGISGYTSIVGNDTGGITGYNSIVGNDTGGITGYTTIIGAGIGGITGFTSVDINGELVTDSTITNWNTAHGWGDHSQQGYATETYVDTAVANLVDTAPGTLDTLNELAAALGNDENFATTVTNLVADVQANVDTLSGSLSTVATSGSYADLSNKPTIPSLGNFTLNSNNITAGWGNHIYVAINGEDAGDPPALINRAWRFSTDGSFQFIDPLDFPSPVKGTISPTTVTEWNTAYAWGDHSAVGYLTAYTETDPVVGAVTGIVKSDGAGNITAAVAGTDYSTFDGAYTSLSGAPTLANVAISGDYNDLINKPAADIGNFTFSSNTLGVSDADGGITINANGLGEIVMSDNVGIQNENPGYMLHVGKKTDITQTGSIGIAYGNVEILSGNVFAGTAYLMGGEVSLTWDWSDGQGAGSNPGDNHGRFGIFKNGSLNDPWLTFDRDAPADVLAVDAQGRLIVTNGSGINTTATATSYSDTNFKVFDPWGPLFVTNRNLASYDSGTTSITDVCHSFYAEANVTENLTRYDRIRGFSSSLDVLLNGYQWDAWNKFSTVAGSSTSIKVIGSGTISQAIGGSGFSIINATDGALNVADTANDSDPEAGEDLGVSVGVLGGSQLIVTDTSGNSSTVDIAAGLSVSVLVDNSADGASDATITNAIGLYLPYRVSQANSWARINGSGSITNRFSIHSEDPAAVLRNYGDIETNGSIKFANGSTSFKVVSAPASSVGQSGDITGMIANDAIYHYYCTADYDGVTNIWKRVAWGSDTW